MSNIERSTLAGDPEGCICPQDYVKTRCPVHDPNGTYYLDRGRPAPCPNCAGAVGTLIRIATRDYDPLQHESPGSLAREALAAMGVDPATYRGQ